VGADFPNWLTVAWKSCHTLSPGFAADSSAASEESTMRDGIRHSFLSKVLDTRAEAVNVLLLPVLDVLSC
jgi:hypothetical protein